jgi:hypothetical protein
VRREPDDADRDQEAADPREAFQREGVENTDSEGKQRHAVNQMTSTIKGRTGDSKALNSLIA